MARPLTTASDWNAMRLHPRGSFELWSGYPAEIAPDLIVCPLLCGRARGGRRADRACTISAAGFIVLHARDEDHLALLRAEVLPRLRDIPFAYVLDASTGTVFPANHDVLTLRQQDLAPLVLRIVAGFDGEANDLDTLRADLDRAFASVASADEIATFLAEPSILERRLRLADRIERAPIRLWEAMLWRSFHYRWELYSGEVPLVGELRSELGANRTLVQCVSDAETAFGRPVDEQEGWLVCGPLRLRQRGTRVELRYRPTAADRRVAFAPRSRLADDELLPTLFGVLLSGGGSGKSELIDGYTDSVIEVYPDQDPAAVAAQLADEVRRITSAEVVVAGEDEHDPGYRDVAAPPGAWRVRFWSRFVAVDMPMMRDDRVAWDVLSGDGEADSFVHWRWARERD